jgi:hypothetical protein
VSDDEVAVGEHSDHLVGAIWLGELDQFSALPNSANDASTTRQASMEKVRLRSQGAVVSKIGLGCMMRGPGHAAASPRIVEVGTIHPS